MIKLTDLLFETLPKNKWIRLRGKGLEDHSENIWKIIKRTYQPLGGHPTYKSAKDITMAKDVKFWHVIDVDDDEVVDAMIAGKIRKRKNVKIGVLATDGSSAAKSAVVSHQSELLKKSGYFAELSGRPAEIMISKGANIVDDEELIRSMILNKDETKDFKWLGNGWYQRRLRNGKLYKKVMVGFPRR